MARRVSFSKEHIGLRDTILHYNDTSDALRLFFSTASPTYETRFLGYRTQEVREELGERLAELDRTMTMSLLAAIEAAFRIDYLQRCYRKRRDAVSRRFRTLYGQKAIAVSLEDDILEIWKQSTIGNTKLIGDLRGAFKFRHWLAHGRYWRPKLGRTYDYLAVYSLAVQALASFPLMAP